MLVGAFVLVVRYLRPVARRARERKADSRCTFDFPAAEPPEVSEQNKRPESKRLSRSKQLLQEQEQQIIREQKKLLAKVRAYAKEREQQLRDNPLKYRNFAHRIPWQQRADPS